MEKHKNIKKQKTIFKKLLYVFSQDNPKTNIISLNGIKYSVLSL